MEENTQKLENKLLSSQKLLIDYKDDIISYHQAQENGKEIKSYLLELENHQYITIQTYGCECSTDRTALINSFDSLHSALTKYERLIQPKTESP